MKTNWYKSFLITAIIVFNGLNLIAQNSDVILTVGNEKVTKKEFEYVFKKNNTKNSEAPTEKSLREYLELYINYKLKVLEAKSLGMDTISSFKKELAGYRKQLAAPYLTDKEVNEKLIKEAFDRSRVEIRASHILVSCSFDASPKDTLAAYNKIMSLRRRVVDKKEDFAKVALEASTDPSAKSNKGDLGYFSVFSMVYPFENICYNTKPGTISNPVRTKFGYHLVKVSDVRPANGEVKVAHIMVRLAEKTIRDDSVKAKQKIEEIYKKLLAGEKFEDLAKQYSDDKQSARNGGALPYFGAGKMVFEFEKEAFALKNPGEYSKPFLSPYGWHIVKMIERKPLPSFEEMRNELKTKVGKDSRSDLNKESFIAKLKKQYNFKEDKVALNKFYDKADTAIGTFQFKKEQAVNPNDVLFTLDGNKFLISDYAAYVQQNQVALVKENISRFRRELYDSYVNKTIMDYEESRLESKYPEFKSLIEEYRDGILLFDLTDKKVWSAAVKDTLGLESYYKQNINKYMWKERLDAVIYTCTNESVANDVRKSIKNKKISQDSLLKRVNQSNPLNLTIKSDKFEKTENAIIDQIEWKKGVTKNLNINNTVVIVKVNKVLKAEPKKLNEIRGAVTSDYQNYLEKKWLEELRSKYTVKVNEEVFKTLIKN